MGVPVAQGPTVHTVVGQVLPQVVDLLVPLGVDVEASSALGVVADGPPQHAELLAREPLHPVLTDQHDRGRERLLHGMHQRELETRRDHPDAAVDRGVLHRAGAARLEQAPAPLDVQVACIEPARDLDADDLGLRDRDGEHPGRGVPLGCDGGTDRDDRRGRRAVHDLDAERLAVPPRRGCTAVVARPALPEGGGCHAWQPSERRDPRRHVREIGQGQPVVRPHLGQLARLALPDRVCRGDIRGGRSRAEGLVEDSVVLRHLLGRPGRCDPPGVGREVGGVRTRVPGQRGHARQGHVGVGRDTEGAADHHPQLGLALAEPASLEHHGAGTGSQRRNARLSDGSSSVSALSSTLLPARSTSRARSR